MITYGLRMLEETQNPGVFLHKNKKPKNKKPKSLKIKKLLFMFI